jgi:Uma2 family endonuclease
MSPLPEHEQAADRLGLIVRLVAHGFGLELMGVRSMTMKRAKLERGREADNAFYIANEPRVRGKKLDFDVDPPPDVAIEVSVTHRDPQMFSVYEGLRVPEIWHFDGQELRVFQLQASGGYRELTSSPALPMLPLALLPQWLEKAELDGESALIQAVLDWIRIELASRSQPDQEA